MHPFLLPGVSSYVVFLVLAFSVGYLDALRRAGAAGFERKVIERVYLAFLFGALAGARLFHVILESPEFYADAPNRVLAFWQGGFSLWGGAIGGLSAILLVCRATHAPTLTLLDAFAPSLLLGVALGRVGCLLAGCCFGLPTGMPWGVVFDDPSTFVDFPEVPLHPTQAYEAGAALVLSFLLRTVEGAPGRLFALALGSYASARFVIEFYRGDVARGFVFGDSLSLPQGLCILAVIAAAALTALTPSRRGQLGASTEESTR